MKGKVKTFSDLRGYGFITGEDDETYFVHYSMIDREGYKSLTKGQEVLFTPVTTSRGPQAFSVREVIAKQEETTSAEEKPFIRLKPNPFTPQDPITDPHKFAGRAEALINAIDCLYNNKNILITGARGIGKSSLSYQLVNLTKGDRTLIDRIRIDLSGFKFNHIVGDHRCLPGNSLQDIAKNLLNSIYVNRPREAESTTKATWEIDLKLLKYKEEASLAALKFDEIALEFVCATEEIIRKAPRGTTGITYLIDEIDMLDQAVQIAPFLKSVHEKLKMDGFKNISFVLSGVSGSIIELIAQHPSSVRLIETLILKPMIAAELRDVVDNCLFGTGTTITPGAKESLIKYSACFPAPLHLLGYHAFKIDNDDNIDNKDVESALNFIVREIKRKEFEGRFDRIRGTLGERILKLLASPKFEKVKIDDIAKRLSAPRDSVAGILGDIHQIGSYVQRSGNEYQIAEPIFTIYLRWAFNIPNN
jgi:CspA family cold shock protein